MHGDAEVTVTEEQVVALLSEQFPDLADRPLARVQAWGTDHVIYRLGDALSVRLPKIGWATEQADKEARWLPVLAPQLPVEVPAPVGLGQPGHGYPYAWCISPWLVGENPTPGGPVDQRVLAVELAEFVLALQRIDTTGAPPPSPDKRGAPLVNSDRSTRHCAELLRDETDVDALLAIWQAGVEAPAWHRAPVWVHRDLADGNLLTRDGHLTGVIDWGGLSAADPAVEIMCAWNLFEADTRDLYLDALGWVDPATRIRGLAWAVSTAVHALPYYRDTNPDIVRRSWRAVEAALAEWNC